MARQVFLRQWRSRRDVNQDALAPILRVKRPQVSKLETGEQPVDYDHLARLADFYGCEAWELLMEPDRADALKKAARIADALPKILDLLPGESRAAVLTELERHGIGCA